MALAVDPTPMTRTAPLRDPRASFPVTVFLSLHDPLPLLARGTELLARRPVRRR